MPRLSLCLIARDEAVLLPGCLASVAGAVDEMVVVDTGSRDDTAAIAAAAGARLVSHAWTGSFADARNVALRHARGRFVLVLDADERLAAGGADALRAAVAADDFDAAFLPLHNADRLEADDHDVLCGAARRGEPVLLPRLLRHLDDLRWVGAVHEHVDDWLRRPGRRLRAVAAPIVHLGYVDEVRTRTGKAARNLGLLEAMRDAEPRRLRPRVGLVRELLQAGEQARAATEAEAAWGLLVSALGAEVRGSLDAAHAEPGGSLDVPGTEACEALVPLATLRAWLALAQARPADALATLEWAVAHGADHPNVDLLLGHALELLALGVRGAARVACLVRARARFERCLARHGELFTETVSPGATGWSAATRLGTVWLLLADPEAAREAFALALALRPGHVEARLGDAEALLDGGAPEAAMAAVQPLGAAARADGWLLGVSAAFALGRGPDPATLLAQARRVLPLGFLAPHRHERLEAIVRSLAA